MIFSKSQFLRPGGVFLVLLSFSVACGSSADEDTTAPTVLSNVPDNDATGIAPNSIISVSFSEAMDPATLTDGGLTLMQGTTSVAGEVACNDATATFTPGDTLALSTEYTASVNTGAMDSSGNALAAAYEWSFTTGATLDTTRPTVSSTNPADGALLVPINRSLTATFSEALNPTTVSVDTFTVTGPGTTVVAGAVSFLGRRATFRPLANLAVNTVFTATLTTGLEDAVGNALASDHSWTFTTSAIESMGPAPVLLGTAGDFAILAKSGIDTVPSSAVTGDIGTSPIDSTAITGFSLTMDAGNAFATSDQVTGQVWAADYASPTPSNLTTAISNMETAYTDAAGRPTPDFSELGAGEIGGLTLVPGLYKWGTGVSIATDVTLDGGPDDVWIFQIAGDITQANGASVALAGGASSENIFWQAFGQVMIGTSSHFEGIVLCQTAIILGTGASANGRLLAQTAVTLDQSTVTQPAQ